MANLTSFHRKLHSIIGTATLLGTAAAPAADNTISFNEHIRPIFIAKCTKCHGGVKADGDLSLLYREEALGKGKSGKTIIVPGKPEESELYRRIITDDIDDKMPLQTGDHAEEPLNPEQIALIKKWIEQGAEWEEHWAYLKPEIAPKPELKQGDWPRTGIDPYVLARIEQNGLTPTPEAPKAQWLRRASLDLTGLPPSLPELNAFEQDKSPDAYEKVVERLLASPHYGERWAAMWMDLARYADSQGYEKDNGRTIWPYRDYLINAFNQDKPYNQFLIEQIAGDLLPNPTAEHLTASAFHRNSQTNTEGGTNDEEFRVTAVVDRVNTTWSALQGFTFGCVQCHSHPYEPIPHENYYQFMAFFNSTQDHDLDSDYPHFKYADNPDQRDSAAKLFQRIKELKHSVNAPGKKLMEQIQEKEWQLPEYSKMESSRGSLTIKNDHITHSGKTAGQTHHVLKATVPPFTAIRITITPEVDDPADLPVQGSVLSHIIAQKISKDGKAHDIPLSYVFADDPGGYYEPRHSLQGNANGFGGYPKLHRQRRAVIVTQQPVSFAEGESLQLTLHQKATVTGNQPTHLRHYQLHFNNNPAWQGLANGSQQRQALASYHEANKQYNEIKGANFPVMQQCPPEATRTTRLFIGGNWLNKGDTMNPAVPEVINPGKLAANNRLEMAKWLASAENPLTARVFTNRIFAELFGKGIVETLGDFGSTGLSPSNQELLDYLAVSFPQKHQWSLKSLLRELVLSAAYRQDHSTTAELATRDPGNRLLARGPRNRLSAEMIRDNALQTSGLLSKKMLGPSVMPPQPDGIWAGGYGGGKWVVAEGEDRYRRGLYTYWRRTVPYPAFLTFDVPTKEVCVTQRISTNTPLHALNTLNDPVHHEAAQALAKRMIAHSQDLPAQLSHGYRLATQKQPAPETLAHLNDLHGQLFNESKDNEVTMTLVANTILNLDDALTK
ncbi:MAG: PSD1 and planctomycete cytochrome C domain-containing protein [Akkermansiaceae bacterium]